MKPLEELREDIEYVSGDPDWGTVQEWTISTNPEHVHVDRNYVLMKRKVYYGPWEEA